MDGSRDAFPFLSVQWGGCGIPQRLEMHTVHEEEGPSQDKSLPPTKECAAEHIKRARLQVLLWRAADKLAPPECTTNLSVFGWRLEGDTPVPVYGCADIAPKAVLEF